MKPSITFGGGQQNVKSLAAFGTHFDVRLDLGLVVRSQLARNVPFQLMLATL